jgi:hypothetical protein
VLAATVKRGGDRRANQQRVGLIPTELGENRGQQITSSRTQALSRIPWETIDKKIDAQTDVNKKISQAKAATVAGMLCSPARRGMTGKR